MKKHIGSVWTLFWKIHKQVPLGKSWFLLALSVIISFLHSTMEVFSVGLIVPLLEAAIGGFDSVTTFKFLTPVYNLFNVTNTTSMVIFTAILIFTAIVIKSILGYVNGILITYVNGKIHQRFNVKQLRQYLKYNLLFFDKKKIGDLTYTLSTSSKFNEFLSYLRGLLSSFFMSVGYLVVMFYISWKITIFVFLVFPFLYLILRTIRKRVLNYLRKAIKISIKKGQKVYRIFSAIRLIKSTGTSKMESDYYKDLSDEVRIIDLKKSALMGIVNSIQEPVMMLSILIVAGISYAQFLSGVRGAIAGFMTFFFILKRFEYTAKGIIVQLNKLPNFAIMMEKSLEPFNRKPWMVIKSGKKPFEGLKKKIVFRNVWMEYDKKKPILKGISFTVKAGQTIAFVGHSGGGKTTAISLIPRLYEFQKGEILIDGTSIRKFKLEQLRKSIGVVSQDITILNDTIKNNLTYGLERKVTKEELDLAVEEAGLKDFIKKKGYKELLGERGTKISGGQRQRLSIARAILRDPQILILDEATSALDTDIEKKVQEALKKVMKGRTVFVIAHRLSTIKNADKIIVLEDGKISEMGSFDKLIKKKKRFSHYWKIQTE